MSIATVLLVLVGAMLGAPARYLLDQWVQSWHRSAFPLGTWVVNVLGSALLGFLAAGAVPGLLVAGAGFGFCGALTTYSTFAYQTLCLLEAGAWRHASLNVIGSLITGLGAAFAAGATAAALWG